LVRGGAQHPRIAAGLRAQRRGTTFSLCLPLETSAGSISETIYELSLG